MLATGIQLTMARIDYVTLDELDRDDVRQFAESLDFHNRSGQLSLPNHYRLEAHAPELMLAVESVVETFQAHGTLPFELVEKLRIVISMANGCRYCTGVFCAIYSAHTDADVVRAFQSAYQAGELDERDQAILEFAATATREPTAVTDRQVEALQADHGLSERTLVEIVFLVNLISGYNRIVDVFDADAEAIYHGREWAGSLTTES